MNTLGIGTDIIEITRIKDAIRKQGFINKVFTGKEIAYINCKHNTAQTAAGIFAAKEAVAKALGTGIGKTTMSNIEITYSQNGQPMANVSGYENYSFFVSISHCKEYAIANAVVCKES